MAFAVSTGVAKALVVIRLPPVAAVYHLVDEVDGVNVVLKPVHILRLPDIIDGAGVLQYFERKM